MKILLISLNFYPEDSAIGKYSTETARYLYSKGHDITVISGFPYYPQWRIWKAYRNKGLYVRENFEGIKIFRYKQYVPKHPTFFKRLIHVFTFTTGNIINVFKAGKQDIVIAIVPFLTSIVLAKMHNVFFRSIPWTHIQDFEVQAMKNSDVGSKSKLLLNSMTYIEQFFLRKSKKVSAISPQMCESLKEKGVVAPYYFPNFIDIEEFENTQKRSHQFIKPDKFNVLYSGNIGEKQDWKLFVEIVKHFSNHNQMRFVIVGNGSKKEWLENKLGNCTNVEFQDLVAKIELPLLLSSTDLHILIQKKSIVNSVMPSKLLGMMASSKPILVGANHDSGLGKVISQSQSGFFVESYQKSDFINEISNLVNMKNVSHAFLSNGFNYVKHHYSKDLVLERFHSELMDFSH